VRQTCEAFEIRVVQGVVSKDHAHILVSCPPEMAPSEIMRRIKGRTSSYLFEEFPYLEEGGTGEGIFGREGIYCATVGQMTEEMIKQYLEHHFEPNPNDNFKMEPE
jgi:putative transposase